MINHDNAMNLSTSIDHGDIYSLRWSFSLIRTWVYSPDPSACSWPKSLLFYPHGLGPRTLNPCRPSQNYDTSATWNTSSLRKLWVMGGIRKVAILRTLGVIRITCLSMFMQKKWCYIWSIDFYLSMMPWNHLIALTILLGAPHFALAAFKPQGFAIWSIAPMQAMCFFSPCGNNGIALRCLLVPLYWWRNNYIL